MLPAVGQGALCIEIRQSDPNIKLMTTALDHPDSRAVVRGERAFLNRLGGSCQVPIAGYGEIKDGTFHLTGLVADLDGSRIFKSDLAGPAASSESIGIDLAEQLLSQGADRILKELQTMGMENG